MDIASENGPSHANGANARGVGAGGEGIVYASGTVATGPGLAVRPPRLVQR